MQIPTHSPLDDVKDLEAFPELVQILMQRVEKAYSSLRGLRKPEVINVFKPLCYISPLDVEVEHPLRKPVAIFNPGAILIDEDRLWVFPRVIPGYFWYPSAIGFFELRLSKLLNGELEKPIKVKIVVYPKNPWDIGGCEDARASMLGDRIAVLYTGIVPGPRKFHVYGGRSTQCLALLNKDSLAIERRGFLAIEHGEEKFLPCDWRDSAFVEGSKREWTFLTRVGVKDIRICWKSTINVDEFTIPLDSLEPILVEEPWEEKIGWSTNAVKIGKDEYLIGWHGVQRIDKRYLNGLAIVDSEGNIKAITNYLLEPTRIEEYYGDRPGVIFGNGLVVYKNYVVWIGGVADQMIGIFVADIDKVMEHMLWIRKR